MANPIEDVGQWLPAAQAGSPEALGQVLEACRAYLLLIARQELDPALQARGGASDLVQQTFLDAQRDFRRFQGTASALLAWMRRLLLNNVANFGRDQRRDKRSVARDVSLPEAQAAAWPDGGLQAAVPSPSVAVMRREEAEALERALRRLPDDYRQVLHLRYREGYAFEPIAQRMQRSANAVRKLWARAIERLREELEAPP